MIFGKSEKSVIVRNGLEFKTVVLNGEGNDRIGVAGLAVDKITGGCPVDRVDQDLLDDGHMIDREGLVAGTEVENLALVTAIGHTAAEYFAALEPADENQLIRSGNIEEIGRASCRERVSSPV